MPMLSKKSRVRSMAAVMRSSSLPVVMPHALGVLQQLGALWATALVEQRGQHDGEGAGVVNAVQRCQLVANHVRGPVLRHASANQAVERHGGGPHQVGAVVVHGLGGGEQARAHFDQRCRMPSAKRSCTGR